MEEYKVAADLINLSEYDKPFYEKLVNYIDDFDLFLKVVVNINKSYKKDIRHYLYDNTELITDLIKIIMDYI